MNATGERRPGQGNGARNGREPARKILARSFPRVCVGVIGALGVAMAIHFSAVDESVVWVSSYSGLLIGLALGNVSGELR